MPSVLGYVMARDEWPLLGVAIANAFIAGVDHVAVVDHASSDETLSGLQALPAANREALTVVSLTDSAFLQQATTAVIAELVGAENYDWVYQFDADEFALTAPDSSLASILGAVPLGVGAVRYRIDQWVAPHDLDDLLARDLERVRHLAVPSSSTSLVGEVIGKEIELGRLNFFEVPFGSKLIVRGQLFRDIGPGAHYLVESEDVREMELDPEVLRVGHVPFLSRRRLDLKCRQGRQLEEDGFPPWHGWQSQTVARIERAGRLDGFWMDHSMPSDDADLSRRSSLPATKVDLALSESFRRAAGFLRQATATSSAADLAHLESGHRLPIIQSVALDSAIKAVHRFAVDRESALAERNGALAERDGALAERDGALAERDGALKRLADIEKSRSWRLTSWLRATRAFVRRER